MMRAPASVTAGAGAKGHGASMPKEKMPPGPAKGKPDEPPVSGKRRAERFATWDELGAAVLAQCRSELAQLNPTLDIADFERQGAVWIRRDDEALRVWRSVRDACVAASDYLDQHPGPHVNIYAALLEAFLSSRCEGHPGDPSFTVRERLSTWRWPPTGASSRRRSFRTDLVSMLVGTSVFLSPMATSEVKERSELFARKLAPPQLSERVVRELALLSLLAGCEPASATARQKRRNGGDRPTVSDVLRAEANAVRLALASLERPDSRGGAAAPEGLVNPPRQGG